jgi:hypothetical protein
MIIRTNPPGALAYVDDNEVGLTPVAISPIYYGNRKIRLVKDGCETLTIIQSVPPPWYEIPPLDFVSETLVPGKIRDVRTFDYQLYPQAMVQQDALLGRAETLRHGTQTMTGVTTPGYRINQPPVSQIPVAGPANPGGTLIGGQPSYPLPPGMTAPSGPVDMAPPGTVPQGMGPQGPGLQGPGPMGSSGRPIYQGPPTMSPGGPAGPSNVGSQPYFPLPSGG